MTPRYSVVIPTFRRAHQLSECLESLCALQYDLSRIEVLIIDNGGAEHTESAAQPFKGRLSIRYLVNPVNRGYGFSVNRGIVESSGDVIMLLNDDARPQPDCLTRCDDVLSRGDIGCIGFRVIEEGYLRAGTEIGRLLPGGGLIGNFDIDCGEPIEVDHVYGFCYIFTREAVRRAGVNDLTLLAKPYSSGDCIETDHCLSIRKAGLKVIFHPGMVARHLAKPRPDMSEVSLRWHLNSIRNRLYLFLKHYGPFGLGGAAVRLTFLQHVGIISLLKNPNRANWEYFTMAMRARSSAYWHWLKCLSGPRFDSPDRVLELIRTDRNAVRQ